MRKSRLALLLAIAAGSLGLMGWGVTAAFTDSGTATANISVGTFGFQLSSSTSGAVISPDKHTVSLTCPMILSSAAGSCALDFKVTNTGSIPMTVTVATTTAPTGDFSDAFVNPGAQVIASGGNYDYTGGIKWGVLTNADLGATQTVTYTISATG